MRNLKQHQTVVLVPLVVMLLLTLLTGFGTYQLGKNWEKSTQAITIKLVQEQFVNNLYRQLAQVQLLQPQNPDEAYTQWKQIQQTVTTVNNTSSQLTIPELLKRFMADDTNISRISAVLDKKEFRFSAMDIQQSMETIQLRSQQVTLIMSGIMLGLGLLLVAFTARDLLRLFKALSESRDWNNKIQEAERQRIAQDLHDDVIQELVVLKRQYKPERVDHIIDAMRRICNNLKPQILEDLGLESALMLLVDDLKQLENGQVGCQISENLSSTLPLSYQLPLFRIIQELLNNIRRHAKATKVTLTVIFEPSESPMLRLYVRDNGCGFNPNIQKTDSLGLTGVRERVEQLDGKMEIQSKPNTNGSTFRIFIPITDIFNQSNKAILKQKDTVNAH